MKLIIGGAYQGKLDYAKEKFGIKDEDVFDCVTLGESCDEMDFSKRCIYHAERYALWCVKNGIEAKEVFSAHSDELKDSIIICEDIFCGVVPLGGDLRAWREMCGRLCTSITRDADEVIRIFCGLPQKLS